MPVSSIPLTEVEAWELMALDFDPEVGCQARAECPNEAEYVIRCRACAVSYLYCGTCVELARTMGRTMSTGCAKCKALRPNFGDAFEVIPIGVGGSHE